FSYSLWNGLSSLNAIGLNSFNHVIWIYKACIIKINEHFKISMLLCLFYYFGKCIILGPIFTDSLDNPHTYNIFQKPISSLNPSFIGIALIKSIFRDNRL